MRYIFCCFFLLSFSIAFSQRKEKMKIFLGAHFPGSGFTVWKIEGDNLFYRSSGNTHFTDRSFNGKGLNIFYGLDLLVAIRKFKFGASLSQEYIHIHKFYNKELNLHLEPSFRYNEQTHFEKVQVQLEADFRKKRSTWSFNMQGGLLFPETNFFAKEYITRAYTLNAGPVLIVWLNHKVDFVLKLSGEYRNFIHRSGQSYTSKGIILDPNSGEKLINNQIYSLNINTGIRVNILKKTMLPRYRT